MSQNLGQRLPVPRHFELDTGLQTRNTQIRLVRLEHPRKVDLAVRKGSGKHSCHCGVHYVFNMVLALRLLHEATAHKMLDRGADLLRDLYKHLLRLLERCQSAGFSVQSVDSTHTASKVWQLNRHQMPLIRSEEPIAWIDVD
ncbi:hypothetical protein D3C80_1386220 [compost metagenome]